LGVESHAYPHDILRRLPGHPNTDIGQLTPAEIQNRSFHNTRAKGAAAVLGGYTRHRTVTLMMLDGGVVAVNPARVYRLLKAEGLLANRWNKPSCKGTGFVRPLAPHEHWYIDVSYVDVDGTF
jgi:hypothetical protein